MTTPGLSDSDFVDKAWEDAKVLEGLKDENDNPLFHYRVDVLWHYIAKMCVAGSSSRRFKLLPKVAEIVLIIPHSNAGLERQPGTQQHFELQDLTI